jgi:hypothetical protein
MAGDVRIALAGELFDGGVKGIVHWASMASLLSERKDRPRASSTRVSLKHADS